MEGFKTNNDLMKLLLANYAEDKPDFSEYALKIIDEHFEKQTKRNSKIDPQKLGTKSNFISKLRTALLEQVGPLDVDGQSEFNQKDIKEQLKFQAQARVKSSPEWVLNLEIMPANLVKLKMSQKEIFQLEQIRTKRTNEKLRNEMIQIDGDEFLKRLLLPLEDPIMQPWQALTLGIQLATGRRSVEVLKTGQFYLSKIHNDDGFLCMFDGQAKSGLFTNGPFEIPLLAPFSLVKNALDVLRRMLPDNITMTNSMVNETFAKGLNNYLDRIDNRLNAHSLRAIYAMSCYQLLPNTKMSLMGFVSKILGHARLGNAAHYQHFQILNLSGPYKPINFKKVDPVVEQLQQNVDQKEWETVGAAELKRVAVVKDLMNRRLKITPTSLRTYGAGSINVNARFVERNKTKIDKYNATLED